jgi:hypothetical protein
MHEVQTVIELTITSSATSAEAAEAQMTEAVDRGRMALDHIKPAPLLHSADGEVADVVSGISMISAAWKPLLEKIELCTKIVDGISEV